MKILLSPAKSINFDNKIAKNTPTIPLFINESEYLSEKLKKLSINEISKLMKVSDTIAELNYNRFQNWHLPFTAENSRMAADIFTGAAYQGLDYPTLSVKNRDRGQRFLRILSGMYGLLKPLDLIQPYRLEMGTSFKVTSKVKNLYLYWEDKIVNQLNQELANDNFPVLINLASAEYFKAAKLKHINYQIITPIFKDITKTGDYKVIMTFAKKARGLMTRYIIENNLKSVESLQSFDTSGYWFDVKESTEFEFVFKRG